MDPLAVRPAEAARALGVSRTALYGLLSSGELESVKLGASRLIPVAALHEYVERRRAASSAERMQAQAAARVPSASGTERGRTAMRRPPLARRRRGRTDE